MSRHFLVNLLNLRQNQDLPRRSNEHNEEQDDRSNDDAHAQLKPFNIFSQAIQKLLTQIKKAWSDVLLYQVD